MALLLLLLYSKLINIYSKTFQKNLWEKSEESETEEYRLPSGGESKSMIPENWGIPSSARHNIQ